MSLSPLRVVSSSLYLVGLLFLAPASTVLADWPMWRGGADRSASSDEQLRSELLSDFDVAKEASGPRRAIVKELRGIRADGGLSIAFTPKKGRATICGVEVIREKD